MKKKVGIGIGIGLAWFLRLLQEQVASFGSAAAPVQQQEQERQVAAGTEL